jgi:methylenetetrahydrofolate dehydrogenase (NADP+)/methenyltetrahydrofolate cyclohydrolase
MVMFMILDGRLVASTIKDKVTKDSALFYQENGYKPCLATILVGNDPASITYVSMKEKACHNCGIDVINYHLSSSSTDELLELINKLNNDSKINGILIQHPLPQNIDEQKCFDSINIEKDVDGVSSQSFGLMSMKREAYLSCTPDAVLAILDYYHIDVKGMKTVVIGRSAILGKPMAMALLNMDATVTICHSKTKNLEQELYTADLIVAAIGKAHFIKSDKLKKDVIIIDCGYSNNMGDVDLDGNKASYYTPVPGGVGPVTIAKLLEHTLISAQKSTKN